MNLDTFFEKFDLFADAPNAVAKMRELILDLAVRGKLVHQDPTDEPASTILRSIEEDIATAVKNRKIRNPKPARHYEGEIPFALPEGWEISQLGSLTSAEDNAICDGPFGSKLKTEHYIQTPGYAVIRLGNIGVGHFIWGKEGHISQEHYLSLSSNHVKPGDLIVAGLADPLVRCCEVPEQLGPAVNKADCFRVRVHSSVDRTYVRHYLNSTIAKAFAAEENHGITRERINLSNAKALPVPLPPLAEQKRIVAKVDELMALCDRLEAQQQERETRHTALAQASLTRFADAPTPANLELLFHKSYSIEPAELRKSILTLAVQGNLVRQDYRDETASDLLIRLGLRAVNYIDDTFSGASGTIPASWTMVRFEEIALIAGGVTLGRKITGKKLVNLPYLRVANVKRGEIDISDVKEVLIGEDEIERYALRQNDLLMIEGGDWDKVGRAAIWDARIPLCLHQNHVFRARMKAVELMPIWIERYINSPIGRQYFENAAKQTTNLASINMRQVRACPIAIPPLPEQKRIVAKVEQLMAWVDRLEAQLAESRGKAAALLEAVVAELSGVG